ncbi:hypothetical protein [Polaribacter marinus]
MLEQYLHANYRIFSITYLAQNLNMQVRKNQKQKRLELLNNQNLWYIVF